MYLKSPFPEDSRGKQSHKKKPTKGIYLSHLLLLHIMLSHKLRQLISIKGGGS